MKLTKGFRTCREFFAGLYYDSRLKHKLVFSYSFFIFALVLLISLSFQYIFQRNMEDAEKKLLNQSMNRLNDNIDYFFENYMSKSDMIFENSELQQILSGKNVTLYDQVASHRRIKAICSQFLSDFRFPFMKNSYYFGGSIDAAIYANNDTLVPNGQLIMSFREIKDQDWCRELFNTNKLFSWQSKVMLKGADYVAMNRRLINFPTAETTGVLKIYIPVERIKNIIERNIQNQPYNFIYMDSRNNEIFYTGSRFKADAALLSKVKFLNLSEGINHRTIGNEKFIVGCMYSDITGWKLIYLVPLTSITRKLDFIGTITIMTILLSIAICIIIATIISSFVTKRVKILVQKTNSIKEGDLSVKLNIRGNDEIGQLDRNFNSMISRINNLIENEYKSQIAVNKTKLELLQEQINPHLLYNTLSMMGYISRKENRPEIADTASNLISFYKGILNEGKIISCLRAEIDMIKRYVDITRFVYDLDLDIVLDIDDDVLEYYSIKLFLQPIVENAIIHGIRPLKWGVVLISCKTCEDSIIFTVSDNGVGMEKVQLQQLLASLKNSNMQNGYGLCNVARRISLFFGDGYGLDISSVQREGTTVKVTVPKLTEQQITDLLERKYLL